MVIIRVRRRTLAEMTEDVAGKLNHDHPSFPFDSEGFVLEPWKLVRSKSGKVAVVCSICGRFYGRLDMKAAEVLDGNRVVRVNGSRRR